MLLVVVALVAALVASGLPAAACPDERCCSDECSDDGDHEQPGSDHRGDAPSCPPLCSMCPGAAPVIGTSPTVAIVAIHAVAMQPAIFVAPTRAKTPPPDGVFHPPRASA
jgi:hypothetical protein